MSDEWELTEEEQKSGRVVWVCENGHVDVLHKQDGNYLDLCAACKDGSVCTPTKTLGRRSKVQRDHDRDLGLDTRRPRRAGRSQAVSPVTIHRPGEESVELEAAELRAVGPEAPFVLSSEDRAALLAGKLPRISFPREAPADYPEGRPYPADPGDILDVAPEVMLVVTGQRVLVDERVLVYEIHDSRPETGGELIATVRAPDKPAERMGGPQFRPEREPPPLSPRELRNISDQVRSAEIAKLTRTRDDLGRHLKDQDDAPRDVRFHLRKSIEAIERRIENIEGEMKQAA